MSSLAGGTKWVAFETIISRVVQLVAVLYVARVVGPEAMGTVALLLVVLEILNLFSQMGLSQALIHAKNPSQEQLRALYLTNWLLAFVTYFLIYFLAPYFASFFEESELTSLLRVAGLSILISAIGQQIMALLQKELEFQAIAVIGTVSSAVNAAVTISLAAMGFGIWSIVVGQLVGVSVRSLVALGYGIPKGLFHGFGLSFGSIRSILAFGLYQTGSMSLNMINSRADQLIIGKVIGASALGLYSMGSQITLQAMQQINSIATKVAFPAVAKNQDDLVEVKRIYLAILANTLMATAPLFVGLAVLSPLFISVVLGDEWMEMSTLLSILSGYVLVRSLGNISAPLVMGLGKADWAFYWNMGLLFVVPGVVYLASLSGNVEAIGFALFLTQLVLVFMAYLYWIRRLIGPCAREYVSTIARPLIPALGMGGMLWGMNNSMAWQSNPSTLVIMIIVGMVIYLLLSLLINRRNLVGFLRGAFTKSGSVLT